MFETKLLREWKKVFESDLSYVSYELKELVAFPALIILEGEMGSGKTTFTKNFIGDAHTASPTYSVISEHNSIVHADFYRLEEREDILHLEIPLYLENKQYFFVEWGRKFYRDLIKEVPDSFSRYLLEISLSAPNQSHNEGEVGRNFTLSEILPD